MIKTYRAFFALLLFILSLFVVACSSYSQRMYDYYSVKSNYIEVHGTIEEINLSDGTLYLNINFDESTFSSNNDNTFKIIQSNQQILFENGFYDQVNIGDAINFYSAPRIFGDGYIVPIIFIEVDDIVYLPFDTGLNNLLVWCSS